MMKRLASLLLAMLLVMGCVGEAGAGNKDEHEADMEAVLFGSENFRASQSQARKNDIDILIYATSLCIDQFGGNSQSYLNTLRQNGVAKLPKTIDKIDLSATANDHRGFTHLGWDHDNKNKTTAKNFIWKLQWKLHWEKRKDILRNSVEHVFDFKNKNQKEAFCRLLYYTHILGDHMRMKFSVYTQNQEQLIILADNRIKPTLLSELLCIIDTLFDDQKHTAQYSELIRKLSTEESLISTLLKFQYVYPPNMEHATYKEISNISDEEKRDLIKEPENMNTPEKFERSYIAHACEIHRILSTHIPQLLKQEPFFNRVFP